MGSGNQYDLAKITARLQRDLFQSSCGIQGSLEKLAALGAFGVISLKVVSILEITERRGNNE